MSPTPDRLRSVQELYRSALGMPPDRRAVFLTNACDDETLRREVESLLRCESGSHPDKSPVQPAEIGPGEDLRNSPGASCMTCDSNCVL